MSESDGDAYLIYDPDISSNSFFGEDGISAVAVRDELDPMDWNQWDRLKVDSNYAIMLDALSNSFVAVHDKGSDIYLPLRNLFQKILSRKEDLRRLAGRSSFELLDEFFLVINEVVASSDLKNFIDMNSLKNSLLASWQEAMGNQRIRKRKSPESVKIPLIDITLKHFLETSSFLFYRQGQQSLPIGEQDAIVTLQDLVKGLSNIDDELLSGGCETILPLTGGFLQVVPSVPLLPQPISLCSKEKPEQILSLSIFVDPGCFLYQRIRMRFLLEAFFSSCEESGRDAAMKSALEQESKLFVNGDHDPDLSLSFLRTVSPHNLSRGLIYCTGADIGYWRMEAQAILLLQHAVVAFIRKIGINFQRRSETPRNTSESQNYLQVFLGSYSSAIKRSSQYCTSALLEFLQRDKSETDATRNLFSKAFPHTP